MARAAAAESPLSFDGVELVLGMRAAVAKRQVPIGTCMDDEDRGQTSLASQTCRTPNGGEG
jgi:hypothetical protein